MRTFVVALICALLPLLFVACGSTQVGDDPCTSDADCTAAACCHATACVAKANAPDCSGGVACTADCRAGTIDCGGGCFCQAGRCAAHLMQ